MLKLRKGLILITGGAGFIGSWLVEALLERGFGVRVLDDFSTGSVANLSRHPLLDVCRGDVTDPKAVEAAVRDSQLVVHLASVVGMRLAHTDAERSYRVSIEGTRNVLNAARCRVVVASSSAVYGKTPTREVCEEEAINDYVARSYDGGKAGYALGKFHAEQLSREASRRGTPVTILRFFNVIGPRQTDLYGMVLPTFVRCAIEGKPLVVYGDGTQTRTFCDIRTVCDLVLRLFVYHPCSAELLNIGGGDETSINDLARIVLEETGSRSPTRYVPYQDIFPGRSDVMFRRPDTRRLEAAVGRVTWPAIRTIVRDIIEWERSLLVGGACTAAID